MLVINISTEMLFHVLQTFDSQNNSTCIKKLLATTLNQDGDLISASAG